MSFLCPCKTMQAASCALFFMCNAVLVSAGAGAPHERRCGSASCQKWQHLVSDDGEESSLLQLSQASHERADAEHVEVVVSDNGETSFVSGLSSLSSFGQGCVGNDCIESLDDADDEDSFLQTQKGLFPQRPVGLQVQGNASNMDNVWKSSPIAGCTGFDCIKQYVSLPDQSYEWKDTGFRLTGVGSMYDEQSDVNWTGYVLNMTSQTWPVPVSNPVWWHVLIIIVPDNKDIDGRATLELDFGIEPGQGSDLQWRIDNRKINQRDTANIPGAQALAVNADNLAQSLSTLKTAVQKAAYLATKTRAIAASLMNLPNSYQIFQDDLLGLERSTDILKSYTYGDFMRHPDHPEVIHELPVAKAVVRAMDTVTAFTASLTPRAVSEFMVVGYSKLGAASFVACALDTRVKACAPMAISMSQLGTSGGNVDPVKMKNAEKSAFQEMPPTIMEGYVYPALEAQAKSMAWKKFHLIADPISWTSRLSKPMLLVLSASDEFNQHYMQFGDAAKLPMIPAPSSLYIEPNTHHINVLIESLPTASSFLRGFLLGQTTPNISSSFDPLSNTLTVRQISQHMPTEVRLWTQHGEPFTFRDTILQETSPLSGIWSAKTNQASFISLKYEWPEPGFAFSISTLPTAIPLPVKTFP